MIILGLSDLAFGILAGFVFGGATTGLFFIHLMKRLRQIVRVTTRFGIIRIQILHCTEREPGIVSVRSDCVAAALEHHVKWQEVSLAALDTYRKEHP